MNYKTIDLPRTTAFASKVLKEVKNADISPQLKEKISLAMYGLSMIIELQNRSAFCIEQAITCDKCRLKGRCFNAKYQNPCGCFADFQLAIQADLLDDMMRDFDKAEVKVLESFKTRGNKQCK